MKSTLHFNLNLPEDKEAFEDALNGSNYKRILQELDKEMRKMTKYEDLDDKEQKIVDILRTLLYDELNEYKIDIY